MLSLASCSVSSWLPKTEGCKIRTIVNQDLQNYLSSRYHSTQAVRMAILPFTVPESFARPGDEAHHFGRRLAKNFQEEFLQRGTVQIVELFNRDNWPGKRDDFFSGNYQAIEYARNAGYDLVLTGHMDDITDAEQIVVYTKVIDVNNSVTIWSSRTTAYSRERSLKKELDRARIGTYQPSIFPFYEQGAELARCTVAEINESEEMVPE